MFLDSSNPDVKFKVKITDCEILSVMYKDGDISEEDKKDIYENPSNYIVLNYTFDYWARRRLPPHARDDLHICFDVSYPNELNDRVVGHTEAKDFGYKYIPGETSSTYVYVTIRKDGLSDEEIYKLGQAVKISVVGIGCFLYG